MATLSNLVSALRDALTEIEMRETLLVRPREDAAFLRAEIQAVMAEQGITAYEGASLGITRRVTNSVVIEDMDAFVETLKAADLYDVCLAPPKIDTKSAIKRAKEHDLPGLVTKTTETLVVTPKQAA